MVLIPLPLPAQTLRIIRPMAPSRNRSMFLLMQGSTFFFIKPQRLKKFAFLKWALEQG